jgi:hypothetical protein
MISAQNAAPRYPITSPAIARPSPRWFPLRIWSRAMWPMMTPGISSSGIIRPTIAQASDPPARPLVGCRGAG